MKLKELEFTLKDFEYLYMPGQGGPQADSLKLEPYYAQCLVNQANSLLEKKLIKSKEVYCTHIDATLKSNWHRPAVESDTHKARLVCIEDIDDPRN